MNIHFKLASNRLY